MRTIITIYMMGNRLKHIKGGNQKEIKASEKGR